MQRFLVKKKLGDSFELSKETVKHIKVLRLGARPFLCNYEGVFYECTFAEPNLARIHKKLDINHELEYPITLAIGVLEPKAMEFVLQKATELGVSEIIPFTSKFTSKRVDYIETKRERLEAIIEGAVEQSFRNKVPKLSKVMKFEDLFNLGFKQIVLADERATEKVFKPVKEKTLLIVGPEGGLDSPEVIYAKKIGSSIVSLGKTILRAETAALAFIVFYCKIK